MESVWGASPPENDPPMLHAKTHARSAAFLRWPKQDFAGAKHVFSLRNLRQTGYKGAAAKPGIQASAASPVETRLGRSA
jgi:hypothetical protein